MKVNAPASHIFSPIRQGTLTLLILCLAGRLGFSSTSNHYPACRGDPVCGYFGHLQHGGAGTDPVELCMGARSHPCRRKQRYLTIPAVTLTDAGDYSVHRHRCGRQHPQCSGHPCG